jgi:hypothetical protein
VHHPFERANSLRHMTGLVRLQEDGNPVIRLERRPEEPQRGLAVDRVHGTSLLLRQHQLSSEHRRITVGAGEVGLDPRGLRCANASEGSAAPAR